MPKSKKSWDLFLSYSSRDRDKADLIIKDLESAGLTVWYDRKEITGGDRIREKIANGIRKSSALLILVSPTSLRSQWVLNELDAAMIREIEEKRKIVIPVLLGDISVRKLPSDIRGKNHIDLRYRFKKRYEQNRITILNSLEAVSEPPIKSLIEIPIDEEGARYVLAYRYVAAQEKYLLEDEFIEDLARIYLKTYRGESKEIAGYKRAFLKKYGIWGIRQLVAFFLDHTKLSLTRGFTDKEFGGLLAGMDIFVTLLQGREVHKNEGLTPIMGIKRGEDVLFKLSKHPKWQRENKRGTKRKIAQANSRKKRKP